MDLLAYTTLDLLKEVVEQHLKRRGCHPMEIYRSGSHGIRVMYRNVQQHYVKAEVFVSRELKHREQIDGALAFEACATIDQQSIKFRNPIYRMSGMLTRKHGGMYPCLDACTNDEHHEECPNR